MLPTFVLPALLPVLFAGAAAAPATCPKIAEPADGAKLATVDGQAIGKADVDKTVAAALCKARTEYAQHLFEIRRGALDALIDEKLLAAEAKKRGLPNAAALETQIARSAPAPDDAMARQLYEQNKDRVGGRTYEELRPQIMESMANEAASSARATLIASLKTQHKVQDMLEPIRFPVEAKGPTRGPANAAITVVIFADFQCPYCSRGAETLEAVRRKHPNDIKVVYRDYPLPFHEMAKPSAVAGRCAGQQGKFWEMHDRLFAEQANLGAPLYSRLASELKLDIPKFTKCMNDPSVLAAIDVDQAAGETAGVDGTPAFYINGVRLSGAQPEEAFEAIIGPELAKHGKK